MVLAANSLPQPSHKHRVLPSVEALIRYLRWRAVHDCRRNSISMLAQAHFTHETLHGEPREALHFGPRASPMWLWILTRLGYDPPADGDVPRSLRTKTYMYAIVMCYPIRPLRSKTKFIFC